MQKLTGWRALEPTSSLVRTGIRDMRGTACRLCARSVSYPQHRNSAHVPHAPTERARHQLMFSVASQHTPCLCPFMALAPRYLHKQPLSLSRTFSYSHRKICRTVQSQYGRLWFH